MINQPIDEEMPAEIDFSKATRGRHHVPAEATVFLPASIEEAVDSAQLLTEVLEREIAISEALK